jgi:hypothetical protein
MQWGKNIGAFTVWVSSELVKRATPPSDADLTCNSLFEFAHLLDII